MVSKMWTNLAVEARKYAKVALDRLVWLVTNAESHNTQLAAALALLDRGFGRPTQTLDVNADIKTSNLHLFAEMSASDQRAAAAAMRAIEHRPDALSLACELMDDDSPVGEITSDDLGPAA